VRETKAKERIPFQIESNPYQCNRSLEISRHYILSLQGMLVHSLARPCPLLSVRNAHEMDGRILESCLSLAIIT
jgi:hypothetical protein